MEHPWFRSHLRSGLDLVLASKVSMSLIFASLIVHKAFVFLLSCGLLVLTALCISTYCLCMASSPDLRPPEGWPGRWRANPRPREADSTEDLPLSLCQWKRDSHLPLPPSRSVLLALLEPSHLENQREILDGPLPSLPSIFQVTILDSYVVIYRDEPS